MPIFKPNTIYILDGALGTELQRRGYKTTLPLWSAKALFDCPEVVKKIHKEYILAGADIITTNTFRTQRRSLAKAGLGAETERINRLAVELAQQARQEATAEANITRPIYIAGSLTTLEDCYRADLVPPDSELRSEHAEQANLLADGIDFFLLETFNTLREIKAAAEAAAATGKPLAVSFITNENGDLFNGDSLKQAVNALNSFHPLAYLVNCVPPSTATITLRYLHELMPNAIIGAYANGDGHAHDDQGWLFPKQKSQMKNYLSACRTWKQLGAQIIGGCCGTSPDYTKQYAQLK